MSCALLLLTAAVGCPPALPNTRVGDLCKTDNDCTYRYDDNNKVVRLQVCVRNPAPNGFPADGEALICTRECQARTDCPVGFECTPSADDVTKKFCFRCGGNYDCPVGTFCQAQGTDADGGVASRTCVEKTVPAEDFGKDCAVKGDSACNTGAGFFCHGEILDDPNAYCTKTCTSDADCFTTMYCGTTTDNNVPDVASKKKRCFQRTLCSSCRSDAECTGLNSLCILDDLGRGYCTRACDPEGKMPCTTATPSRGFLDCTEATKAGAQAQKVNACVPRYGRCYGSGAVCDPCRPHTPEDCQTCGPAGCKKISGRNCAVNDQGEGLCLQSCGSSDACGDNPKLEATVSCRDFGTDQYCSASSMALTCWP